MRSKTAPAVVNSPVSPSFASPSPSPSVSTSISVLASPGRPSSPLRRVRTAPLEALEELCAIVRPDPKDNAAAGIGRGIGTTAGVNQSSRTKGAVVQTQDLALAQQCILDIQGFLNGEIQRKLDRRRGGSGKSEKASKASK